MYVLYHNHPNRQRIVKVAKANGRNYDAQEIYDAGNSLPNCKTAATSLVIYYLSLQIIMIHDGDEQIMKKRAERFNEEIRDFLLQTYKRGMEKLCQEFKR